MEKKERLDIVWELMNLLKTKQVSQEDCKKIASTLHSKYRKLK